MILIFIIGIATIIKAIIVTIIKDIITIINFATLREKKKLIRFSKMLKFGRYLTFSITNFFYLF
jgi:hypothetical protein